MAGTRVKASEISILVSGPAKNIQLIGDFLGTVIYVVVVILLAAAQAIAIVVIAFGFIATSVCILVGPIFVPFFIVPKLEWLFWGWFKRFIQYAFYEVIAAGVVFVIANLTGISILACRIDSLIHPKSFQVNQIVLALR